eukprot:46818_1
MEDGPSKLLIQKTFEEEEGENVEKEWIGLSKKYIDEELPIPTSCWIRLLSWDLTKFMFKTMFACLRFILKTLWDITSAYPIPTLVLSLISFIVHWIRQKRRKVLSLRKQVVEIQNLAYDKLVLDCN